MEDCLNNNNIKKSCEIDDKNENIQTNINLEKDIKSFYTLKNIFSFIDYKKELEIIKYNKQLQEKFKININDYKKVSGKYKIGEKNGKGKEYILNTKILIFKGEYSNGKRNGNGKEYSDEDKLLYEGEYSGGKRNGKGKEYSENGKIIFEGEYLNGRRWNGKIYNNKNEEVSEIKW